MFDLQPDLLLFSFSVGKTTGIPIHVFGTETHMTAIVGMALGHRPIPNQPPTAAHTANFLLNASGSSSVSLGLRRNVILACPIKDVRIWAS